MKKLKFLLVLAFFICTNTLLSSCFENKEVKKTVEEFLNTRTFKYDSKTERVYEKLPCYSFDDFRITKMINRGDSLFKVTVKLNPRNTNINLLVRKDSINTYKVIDSWNLIDFIEEYGSSVRIFAKEIGCFPLSLSNSYSDVEILSRMKIASYLYYQNYLDIEKELNRKIEVTTQNWDRGYRNYASGSAIIQNSSSYTLPKLEYEITYYDFDGNITAKDQGIASYNKFHPGDYKSFSFYTANVGDAQYAQIKPVIKDNWVWEFLNKKNWTGEEFEEYLEKYPNELLKCEWKGER